MIIKPDGGEIRPITGIVDTGATFSLFPSYILNYFPDIKKIDHTIWGIMDSPECHLLSELACIDIIDPETYFTVTSLYEEIKKINIKKRNKNKIKNE